MIEIAETWPFGHEDELYSLAYARVAGVDEAGRGPLAGPVVAAAVWFPEGFCPEGVADSKALSEAQREAAYERIVACARYGIGQADVAEIDAINILRATHLAMRRAVAALDPAPDYLLVDGLRADGLPVPHRNLVKGERQSASIAAASILAKVTRDRLMREMGALYPAYNFARHKGYGTPEHLRALAEFGPCPIHRASFAPVAVLLRPANEAGVCKAESGLPGLESLR